MDSLFGVEITGAARFVIAFIVVLALIALTAWLVRRFGSGALSSAGGRGRQPRLAVIDAANVDARRKLILVRRDNVEHLVMIGGPSDVVIEPNIVRAAAARDVSAGRTTPTPDTMPRPVPLEEAAMWPLQPEAASRTPRQAPSVTPASTATQWSAAGHQQRDASIRANQPDTLAELADALAAQPRPEPEPRLAPAPELMPSGVPDHNPGPRAEAPANEQNLAEMAQRLEAVLRRPPGGEPRLDLPLAEPPPVEPAVAQPPAADVSEAAQAVVPEVRPEAPLPHPPAETKKFYETLEQEMASLLGRDKSR